MDYPEKLYVRELRGKKWVKIGLNVIIIEEKDRLRFRFPFNRALIHEIKQFDGARWQPDKHSWTVNNNLRNQFQLKFLADWNPYARYDAPLIDVTPNREKCYKHQVRLLQHGLTRHYGIWAADMGCISGNAIITVNDGGATTKTTLRKLHDNWHSLFWKYKNIKTRSFDGETIRLNKIEDVIYKGRKKVVKLILKSGKSVVCTPDHEIATSYTEYTPCENLEIGQIVLSNGQWMDKDGYIRVGGYKGVHPRYTTGGVYEHILVMEQKIHRFIKSNEVVHHVNGVKHDNNIDNLELKISQSEHAREHGYKNWSNFGTGTLVPEIDEVVDIQEAGYEDVYDIVCADPYHNFIADGVIVHNCGKTLAAIELMEHSGYEDWIYVGPRSAINGVLLIFDEWGAKIRPPMYTYDGLRKLISSWPSGKKAPHGVIFDESSKLKNPSTQRSQSAMHLANTIREEWGEKGFVILMTGTPAPKDVTDWYNQSETAQPGFLREGNIQKFKRRLALIVQKENTFTGGTYPALVSWYDDENKCKHCGKYKDDITHDPMQTVLNNPKDYHSFEKSKNEIDLLYRRMKGLVEIVSKKEALSELPDKIYRLIKVEPDKSTLRAASLIVKRAQTTISGLTLLRELSDGFQYQDTEVGEVECPKCGGNGEYEQPYYTLENDSDIPNEFESEMRVLPCPRCGGAKVVMTYQREAMQIPCPKEQVFVDILEEHEDIGRLVAYGGFTGTVDRMVEIARKCNWDVIRVDGRGWTPIGDKLPNEGSVSLLRAFQRPYEYKQPIVFIGQAGAAGMGLTLTASPSIFYYSNSFNAEDRIQSEDRIHRPGMDINKGATIIDIEHLPSDKRILDNLKAKRRLQDMSLGRFREEMAIESTVR